MLSPQVIASLIRCGKNLERLSETATAELGEAQKLFRLHYWHYPDDSIIYTALDLLYSEV